MTPLQIVINAVDNASSVIQSVAGNLDSSLSKVASDSGSFFSTIGGFAQDVIGGIEAIAEKAAIAGAAISAALAPVVIAAMDTQAATVRLATTSADTADAAANSTGSLAQQYSNLKNQVALAKDSLDKLGATTGGTKGTADQIEQAQIKYDTVNGKLQVMAGAMADAGKTSADFAATFQPSIDAGVKLGFTIDQTTAALNVLEPIMGSKMATSALTAAENMSAASNGTLDVASAAKMLGMAMETGMGKGLAAYGIVVKDGIGGTDLLNAALERTKNQAANQAATLQGSLAVAWATINQALDEAGKSHLPALTDAVNYFTYTVLPGLIKGFSDTIAVIQKIWQNMKDFYAFLKDIGVIDLFKQSWQTISDTFNKNLLPALKQLWDALTPLKPFMAAFAEVVGITLLAAVVLLTDGLTLAFNIFTDLLTVATKVATFFATVLVGALNLVKDAIDAIVSVVSKVGSVGGAIGGAISNTLGNIFKPMAEGGIVSSPTYALIGEAGPEAVIPLSAFNGGSSLAGAGMGGGGGITVNINGGYYLDSNAAKMLASTVGTELVRQLRLNMKLSI